MASTELASAIDGRSNVGAEQSPEWACEALKRSLLRLSPRLVLFSAETMGRLALARFCGAGVEPKVFVDNNPALLGNRIPRKAL